MSVKFTGEVEPSAENQLLDPDLEAQEKKRAGEVSDAKHKLKMFMFKWVLKIAIGLGFVVLLIIFFIIMPFSEIDLEAETRVEWIQNYSTAFLQALGSFGVTVLAVLVSELLKLLYKFMKFRSVE